MDSKYANQFFKFLLAGGLAAFLNIFSRAVFSLFFSYTTSIVLAFFVGLFTAFILMRTFVFIPFGQNLQFQFIRFTIINILALGLTIFVSITISKAVGDLGYDKSISYLVGHIAGVICPLIVSFFGHKFFTFQ